MITISIKIERRQGPGVLASIVGLLERAAFASMLFVMRRKLLTHLGAIRGLRHLPSEGAAIIVANHRSYFDSFAIASLVWILHGRRVWVPTKEKAFRGRLRGLLHRAWGCIPIDQSRPDEAYEAVSSILGRGELVLLFPEGRRAMLPGLLPFRFGAFNLAMRSGVPIIPVALRGAERVIPKGRLWFVRGATASLVVGRPIDPRDLASASDVGEGNALASLLRDLARGAIARVLEADEEAVFHPDALRKESAWLRDRVDHDIERLLDDGVENITPRDARAVMMLTRLALRPGRYALRFRVQYARAYGFWIRSLPRPLAIAFLPGYRRLVKAALDIDPWDSYLHYCLGQYHLQVPRPIGGGPRGAIHHMGAAYANARQYGADPARFAVGYATALGAGGRKEEAMAVLERHFAAVEAETNPRRRRRRERAITLMRHLTGSAPSWVAGEAVAPA
jgi:1-acyl-sn-glycerol-3-phosphate acyltransferase